MKTKLQNCRICISKTEKLICDSCDKWLNLWEKRNESNVAIINGCYYTLELTDYIVPTKNRMLINYYDGRKKQADNIFYYGKIPKLWERLGLTDTAEWQRG